VVVLALAVCAVLAGARSFTAIAEWAADADEETLARLGVSGPVPSESTFRRTLQYLDADAFDALAGEWAAQRTAPTPGRWRVIAWTARPYAVPAVTSSPPGTCSPRSITPMVW
jgi:hypothetical protein